MIELENRLTLIGSARYVISPIGQADLKAVVNLRVKPGSLREDVQEVPGQDGTTRTVLGYADAELTAEITIWDEAEVPKLKRLNDLFRPRREEPVYKPITIVHPAASRWNIKQVYIFSIEESPWSSKNGMTITLYMREWQPKDKRKTQKAKPVKGGGGGGASTGGTGIPEGRDIAAPSKQGVKP
jgi:hypothetical protein